MATSTSTQTDSNERELTPFAPVEISHEKEIVIVQSVTTTISSPVDHESDSTRGSNLNQNGAAYGRDQRVSFVETSHGPSVTEAPEDPVGRRIPYSPSNTGYFTRRNSASSGQVPWLNERSRSMGRDGYTPGRPFSKMFDEFSAEEAPPLPTTNIAARRKKGLRHNLLKGVSTIWDHGSTQFVNGFFLFLPLLYYSRVTAIFEEVQCSEKSLRKAIKANIQETKMRSEHEASTASDEDLGVVPSTPGSAHILWDTMSISACPNEVKTLEQRWHLFIDVVIKEWKIMNLVSVLLLSAIIATMQLGPVFADEIVRYLALSALVCGLMSLVYSCMYTIRFAIMRPVHKAVEWAKEGEQKKTAALWNVWIFLSIPAIWLSWSLLLFIAEIFAFVWLVDKPDHSLELYPRSKRAVQIVITMILVTGFVYFVLILVTLKRYGSEMDTAWIESIDSDQHELGQSLHRRPVSQPPPSISRPNPPSDFTLTGPEATVGPSEKATAPGHSLPLQAEPLPNPVDPRPGVTSKGRSQLGVATSGVEQDLPRSAFSSTSKLSVIIPDGAPLREGS